MAHSPHIFGIRHHGPGSARALLQAFEALRPDIVLIEGPSDGTDMLHWLGHAEMEAPVSLLFYRPDMPGKSGAFPYAAFSPEYQAVRYALTQNIPVRLIDLPQSYLLNSSGKVLPPTGELFKMLAQASGKKSYEEWWNSTIEQRRDGEGVFKGVMALMREMREAEHEIPLPDGFEKSDFKIADQREAYMRENIRAAQAEGFEKIAVVCGAWHAPALQDLNDYANDVELLADITHAPVETSWVPWTYGRLASFAGYGAGIPSPGWYHHLWEMGQSGADSSEIATLWLSQTAELLREERFDASAAHVIEAVRLAESLAALRDKPFPGLPELSEATQTILCQGQPEPMKLIQRRLIVGERMGMVPADAPLVPLQKDLYAEMKRLKLRPEPEPSKLKLDLRHAKHLDRSRFLHRLALLGINWGQAARARNTEGSFTELWTLQWKPHFSMKVIEGNLWGLTVESAASGYGTHLAQTAEQLGTLGDLLDKTLAADLPDAIAAILHQIEDLSATIGDVPLMMKSLPPLVRVMRYGDVRQTDQSLLAHVVETLLTRICIGLPSTCAYVNDDAAEELLEGIVSIDGVVQLIQNTAEQAIWRDTLYKLVEMRQLHGLLAGRITRLLLNTGTFSAEEAVDRFELALSPAHRASQQLDALVFAAQWLDGFLRDAELLVVHDQTYWQVIDRFVNRLPAERFEVALPLLRRIFSRFSEAARRQLWERVLQIDPSADLDALPQGFDTAAAEASLKIIEEILGMPSPSP